MERDIISSQSPSDRSYWHERRGSRCGEGLDCRARRTLVRTAKPQSHLLATGNWAAYRNGDSLHANLRRRRWIVAQKINGEQGGVYQSSATAKGLEEVRHRPERG
ncbi:hypothetical protein PHSY_001057 [Pseudozyma hubeiensis SY62]|uniref:Uncharacterized protein n=1 Tax=Pseudozyma hubeiensis (strain SY62) TaxID=1305764 RepID=R9NY34_PSEHS|nr:hypothetical protein PHSY_001057 [Pseudozyma hubeiensis SY62]GAC93492.1 hypothetical protein PHSY_001057 [Pseudozyma hubeiensis SY62]